MTTVVLSSSIKASIEPSMLALSLDLPLLPGGDGQQVAGRHLGHPHVLHSRQLLQAASPGCDPYWIVSKDGFSRRHREPSLEFHVQHN